MLRWKKRTLTDEQLGHFSNEIFAALRVCENEISATAQSPFLYRRLSIRIEAEAKRRAELANPWQLLLLSVRHAIPAMALVTMVAVGTFWMLNEASPETIENEAAVVVLADGAAVLSEDDLTDVIGWQNASTILQK